MGEKRDFYLFVNLSDDHEMIYCNIELLGVPLQRERVGSYAIEDRVSSPDCPSLHERQSPTSASI